MDLPNSQNDLEARFGFLLQPIKDLARNFDIDLVSSLGDYLNEVLFDILWPISSSDIPQLNFETFSKVFIQLQMHSNDRYQEIRNQRMLCLS